MTNQDIFVKREIGISASNLDSMLKAINAESLDRLIFETIPDNIRLKKELELPSAMTEYEYLKHIRQVASKNKVYRSFIGMGYYETITPSVILRNIFENPGWYTQYTPYQAEISQGRLEALLNFQTVISDLTGMPIANASLLDEGTAAAEAMVMFYHLKNKRNKQEPFDTLIVEEGVFPQTIDVLTTRANPQGIKIKVVPSAELAPTGSSFAVLVQYPNADGGLHHYAELSKKVKDAGNYLIAAADIMALNLLTPPSQWGADAVVGNTQRFGVPMGYGGPHAGYFATKEDYKRIIPGRIIGISKDRNGKAAYRMALQTREQHIRREKATSNICTAQALLAIMAGMYAVYHGPDGLKAIADNIHKKTAALNLALAQLGYKQTNEFFFDTLNIKAGNAQIKDIRAIAEKRHINFYYGDEFIRLSINETTSTEDLSEILNIFARAKSLSGSDIDIESGYFIPDNLLRNDKILTHESFHRYRSETEMMRYIKSLENKDISLTHSMIPLGSCTMKLNPASTLLPVSWPEFSCIHPFAPIEQVKGYTQIIEELEQYLVEITGMTACSLQPNSGAQGEFTGLMCIRDYHLANNEGHRNITLIPSSAHGTNPASAVMAGTKVVIVKCDKNGNVDVEDLKEKAQKHKDNLSSLMITYPSTHGVFEKSIKEITDIVHENGGLVYMDGANMNAQVGFTSPGVIGADVCHLNLHKTFAIPHGGGGPGVGPICVNDKLKPFLPGHPIIHLEGRDHQTAVSAAPFGSASIIIISYAYIRMLGTAGLKNATEYAILNANYIKSRLESNFKVLYTGELGRCAHELIVDLRPYKDWVSAEDVAKRLMDYGFHAPTLSFPVAGTIMIEPTESESLEELDRFCDALMEIHKEIEELQNGVYPLDNNPLHNAPHTVQIVTADSWEYPYSRENAAYPLAWLRKEHKHWPAIGRIDNAYGDRNLICTCAPIEDYE